MCKMTRYSILLNETVFAMKSFFRDKTHLCDTTDSYV